jgi:hypothetical protein
MVHQIRISSNVVLDIQYFLASPGKRERRKREEEREGKRKEEREEENKSEREMLRSEKEEMKLPLFADNNVFYKENSFVNI